jgi:hypothetical protein
MLEFLKRCCNCCRDSATEVVPVHPYGSPEFRAQVEKDRIEREQGRVDRALHQPPIHTDFWKDYSDHYNVGITSEDIMKKYTQPRPVPKPSRRWSD